MAANVAQYRNARKGDMSEEELRRQLFGLALAGDNARKASKELGVSYNGLCELRRQHAGLYETIRHEHVREIEAKLVHEFRENALLSTELQRQATLQALKDAEAGTLKDPGTVAKNAAIAAGVNSDKLLTLTDRPNQIVEHRDPAAALDALAQRLGIVVDSTAEEVHNAEAPALAGASDAAEDAR